MDYFVSKVEKKPTEEIKPSETFATRKQVERPPSRLQRSNKEINDLKVESFEYEDEEEDTQVLAERASVRPTSAIYTASTPSPKFMGPVGKISHGDAVEIRRLLIGSDRKTLMKSWIKQGFYYQQNPNLRYGIVQNEGGTCGVMAAVQGYILQSLYFTRPAKELNSERQTKALIDALVAILWYRVGQGKQCKVACGNGLSSSNLDTAIENLTVQSFSSVEMVTSFITQNIGMFAQPFGLGVLLFVISAILTRGVENIQKDMDSPSNSLIVEHGYCSQELVNLLVVGQASSNVFDNFRVLGEKKEDRQILKGIPFQSDIGYLSLLERLDYLNVEENYKTPKYPIWIIYSESHYSILFSKDKMEKSAKEFDLYYYDYLANQDEEIRLTLRLMNYKPSKEELAIPLEETIRTKWENVKVDWNGTEPFL